MDHVKGLAACRLARDGPGIATGLVDPSDRLNLPVTPLCLDYNFRGEHGQANRIPATTTPSSAWMSSKFHGTCMFSRGPRLCSALFILILPSPFSSCIPLYVILPSFFHPGLLLFSSCFPLLSSCPPFILILLPFIVILPPFFVILSEAKDLQTG